MKSLQTLIVCLGLSLTAHASDVTFNITGGTLTQGGTFSGFFLINSTTELIDAANITTIVPGVGSVNFVATSNDSSVPGLETLTNFGNTFDLAVNGPLSDLAINTLANFGFSGDTHYFDPTGKRYDATDGTLTQATAATPEPSSLLLLGTGALGLAGAFRRRFLRV